MKNILKYLVKRLFIGLITVYIIVTITFFLLHNLPGDPFQEDDIVSLQIKENIVKKYDLDKPLSVQYIKYIKNISKFDLGISMKKNNKSVNSVIKDGFKVSFELGIISILLSILVAIPIGILAAIKKDSKLDKAITVFSSLLVSIPSFILAGLLQIYVVYIHKGILIDKFNLPLEKISLVGFDSIDKKILPVIALSLFIIAKLIRVTRLQIIEIMKQDYIKLAIAKGLSFKNVIIKHCLKNSIISIMSVLGPIITNVLTGSFVIETIFSIPGLGRYYVNSIYERDYTMVLGLTIFYSIFLIIIVILIDLIYSLVNPSIKIGGKKDEI